jgi:acyl-coenzyme A synthetase/AMP-(fatty) acid ligase
MADASRFWEDRDREFDPGPHRICRGRAGSGKGEIVAAAVELRSGAATDTASIIAFCRERLASCKVPVRVDFRTAAQLPRTPTGKIHQPTLARSWQRAARTLTPPADRLPIYPLSVR